MSDEPDSEQLHEDQDEGYDDENPFRPRTPEEYRAAWADLDRLWAGTVAKAQNLDDEQLHESVDGEWSFIQTLRHLAYATDVWVFAVVQGERDPYDPLDLPFDGYEQFPQRHRLRTRRAPATRRRSRTEGRQGDSRPRIPR